MTWRIRNLNYLPRNLAKINVPHFNRHYANNKAIIEYISEQGKFSAEGVCKYTTNTHTINMYALKDH